MLLTKTVTLDWDWYQVLRSSLIHFACIGVAPPRLFTPQAWTVEGEQLQCKQNGSNLIYQVLVILKIVKLLFVLKIVLKVIWIRDLLWLNFCVTWLYQVLPSFDQRGDNSLFYRKSLIPRCVFIGSTAKVHMKSFVWESVFLHELLLHELLEFHFSSWNYAMKYVGSSFACS